MTDIHVTTMSFEAALAELKRQEALREAVANDARELELDELETQPTPAYLAELQAAYEGSNNRAWPCADGYAQQNADQLEWYKNLGRGLAPAKRHMPSRDFLVRQACLNTAVQEHVHCMNGAIAKQYLNARTFGGATATPQFVAAVCAQFRKLVAAYQ